MSDRSNRMDSAGLGMQEQRITVAGLVMAIACVLLATMSASAIAQQKPDQQKPKEQSCRDITFETIQYTVCTVDLATHDIQIAWKAPNGEAYGNLGSFARAQTRAGIKPMFAMNAGMYHADGRPVGLYVEGGRELTKISTTRGPGNFHMKPNGVFYVTAAEVGVLETSRYIKAKPNAQFATQSGPMLVIDGKLHPRFSADGPSLKIRNGVGVRDAKTVVFAISNDGVSFGSFARLFRDELKCNNALYLDGSISSLWAPSAGRQDELWPVGPIVAAIPRLPATKTTAPAGQAR
ncbi:MAG: phosphodiester glycosidase family protein [Hyphomicrobium aestuarii]|nr:phosphodiester glycosidase family protein [Hyphomicrobium aestuarii]